MTGPSPVPVRVVLGQNPGLRTGSGTNTYLLGDDRQILIDTGAGVPAYDRLLREAVERSKGTLVLVLVTHGHRDHLGGIGSVKRMYPEATVRKFPAGEEPPMFSPIADGEPIRLAGVTLQAIHTPGHGPIIEDPLAKIVEDIEHRRLRERQILEALAAGARTIREMVARVYTDVPTPLHRLAEETVWSTLAKLEGEHRVRRTEGGGEDRYEALG